MPPSVITCTVVDEPSVSSPSLEQDGFECAGVDREILQQHIREQRGRLDVAPGPADVLRRDGRNALFEERRRGGLEGVAEGEYRRLESRRPGVIAAELRAARHLEVDVLDRRRRCARPGALQNPVPLCMRERRRPCECPRGCASGGRDARAAGTGGSRTRVPPHTRRRRTGTLDRAARHAPPRAADTRRSGSRWAAASRLHALVNQSRMVSTSRRHQPPSATAVKRMHGQRRESLALPRVTCSCPTSALRASGAISRGCTSTARLDVARLAARQGDVEISVDAHIDRRSWPPSRPWRRRASCRRATTSLVS